MAEAERHEEVVIYKPVFEVVSTVNDLRAAPKPSPVIRILKGSAVAALTGGAFYAAFQHFGVKDLAFSSLSTTNLRSIARKTVGKPQGGFWAGFGLASTISAIVVSLGVHHMKEAFDISRDLSVYRPRTVAKYTVHASKKIVTEPVLHPQQYRKFPLIRKDKLSPNTFRFVFALPKSRDVLGLPTGQHVAIRGECAGKMVARSYTPTSNNSDLGRMELVIKVYPDGLLTNYLANLEINDLVEFRGPKGSMTYTRDLCKSLGMVAGGTGITPMYQLIRAICEDPKDTTQVSLLYANQTEEDILLREELDNWASKFPQKFKVWYILDRPPPDWKYGSGFITKELIEERLAGPSADSKVHLCGPPGMIAAMKKNLEVLGYEKPGSLSKATDQVFMY